MKNSKNNSPDTITVTRFQTAGNCAICGDDFVENELPVFVTINNDEHQAHEVCEIRREEAI